VAEYDLSSSVAERTTTQTCPNCAGILHWDAVAAQLKCESCGQLVAAAPPVLGARIVEYDLEAELRSPRPKGPVGAGAQQMRCKECGAVVEFPDHITAKKCEFCDSPAVLAETARADHYLPESLVPFAVDRARAQDSFRSWLGKLWFRPSNLKEKADISELHGVYVPYWTFDADVTSSWSADAGYYYYETEHYTVQENGRSVTKTREVRRTRWVPVSGRRQDRHDDHLVCASRGLPDELARPMANFQTGQLRPYAREFLQGYSAESYAIELPDAWVRAQHEIADEQERRCARDVPGDTQRGLRVSNRFAETSFKHVLLPVWIAAFRYQEQVFRFLVNGQTGNVSGKAPYSWVKIVAFVVMLVVIAAGIASLWQGHR
jgi:hypothetical protein